MAESSREEARPYPRRDRPCLVASSVSAAAFHAEKLGWAASFGDFLISAAVMS